MKYLIIFITVFSMFFVKFSSFNKSTQARRNIASDSQYFYRIIGSDFFGNNKILWPPYSPVDSFEHPADFCSKVKENEKQNYRIERLELNGTYFTCGTCELFKCGKESERRLEELEVSTVLKRYIEAASKFQLSRYMAVASNKTYRQSCDEFNDIWPCSSNLDIQDIINDLRKVEFPHNVTEKYFKSKSEKFDIISASKNIELALRFIDKEDREKTLQNLKSFSIEKNVHILFREVDSMYMPYLITPGKIVLKDSYVINDSFKFSQDIDNVSGILSFVTILHEYGHFYDDYLSSNLFRINISSSKDWKSFNETDTPISFYSMYSWKENFAESFAAYFFDPLMQCYASNKYKFLSDHIKVNKEIYGNERPFFQINCKEKAIQNALIGREKIFKAKYRYSAFAMFDQIPFYINGSLIRKPPGSYCRKDEFCSNAGMGCDPFYSDLRGHIGRCRALINTLKLGETCDQNEECQSNICSGFGKRRHCKSLSEYDGG